MPGDIINTPYSYMKDALTGEFRLLPIYLQEFNDAPFFGTFGSYPDVYFSWSGINGVGTFTLGGKTFVGISNSSSYSPVIMPWDGVTPMP